MPQVVPKVELGFIGLEFLIILRKLVKPLLLKDLKK